MKGRSQLVGFRKFVAEYRKLIVWATAGSAGTALPLAAAFFSLSPAWPSGIIQVTAIAQLLALALVFQLLKSSGQRVVSRVMISGTIAAAILLPLYVLVVARFIYAEPSSKQRFTRGYECTQNAKLVFPDCPMLGLGEIAKASFEEEDLWTVPSIAVMKSVIVTLWLALFAAISTALASFVIFQSGGRGPPAPRKRAVGSKR